MKRCEAIIVFARLREVRIYVHLSLCLFLILLFLGCAAPKPLIIKNHPEEPPPRKSFFSSIWPIKHKQEEPPQKSTAALHQQDQKMAANSDTADLLNLLKSKNVISADEANQLAEKYGITLPTVKNDNSVAGKSDNGRAEKAAANKTDESRESNQGQFTKSTKEESSEELKKSDKEQKGGTPANIDEEMKKEVSDSAGNEAQKDISSAGAKSGEGQNEKTPASLDEEMKKDISGSAVNDEQKDVSLEDTKSGKGQNEKTPASANEEIKKDIPEPVKNDEQKDVPPEAAKSDNEQNEKTPASANEELKKDVQEQIKNQVQEEVSREIKKLDLAAALPEWIKNIRFGGDIRLRYEHDGFDQNNGYYFLPNKPDTVLDQMNTTTSHDYFRYRARVGMEVPVNDKVDAVIRLATGNDNNPVSTNSTFGDYMNEDKVYFDLAYLKWRPCDYFTFIGGRMPNPWFYSDLVWSPNLNFEGFTARLNMPIGESWATSLTVGAFPLQQNDYFERSKYLAAGQMVVERKQQKGISAKIGAAYYDFNNITGEANIDNNNTGLNDWTAPLYQQKGNTLMNIAYSSGYKLALASEFKELNFTANLDIGLWDPVHVVFLGDYVRNLGFDMTDVAQRACTANGCSIAGDIDGYQAGVAVGYPTIQDFGQWKAYLYYKFLGADAVVDAYTDTDFHLGGTDAKGWIFGADLGLAKNTWLTARWLTANEIHGQQGDRSPLAIDVLQVDLNVRF